jgi:pyruvate/2-oxoglutarate dehydrogenase complex dihydrolipoamide dehydrogenase (E3) component
MTAEHRSDSDPASSQHEFDAILVGTGQAAPALAGRLTAAGWSVAIIERHRIGGTCVNTGCTPTKALVASAYVARLAARSAEYGVLTARAPRVDMAVVNARVAAIVHADRSGLEAWLSSMPRCTFIRGHARFESPHEIRVGHRLLRANKIFLNVGGRAFIPPFAGIDKVDYLTNVDMVALGEVPSHLVVVGGGYIGLEFAQIFRRFGAQVTLIEKGARLLAHEDEDISAQIKSILEREGIAVRLAAECIRFGTRPDGIEVGVDCTTGAREVSGSHVLLAVGRRPNTDDLGLENAGVAVDRAGYITVDDRLQTNVEGIWALGDCNGRGAFTHTAYNDFEIVAANILEGGSRSVADRIFAYALYTDPPLGRVGMTLAQAHRAGRKVRVGTRPMTRVARAVEKGETQGLMQVLVDAKTHEILGAAILGPGGDEAVHTVLAAMSAGAPYTRLAQTMAIHPTVSELIPTVLGELSAPF